MPEFVNIHAAKTHLSRLLEEVQRGATVVIAKAGAPIAQLVPMGAAPSERPAQRHHAGHRPQGDRGPRLRRFLEQEVWPLVPKEELGQSLAAPEADAILGYGPNVR
ncbi:MAG TPA: type II toxin-antitoxin system prevent-host-death family antitoxin [Gemmatimonadales bacterium]|jgi:prevent-host-death family protein|nr:type II toxin-antitoxin system prevent-host-death family antitoxin [Gemmatimonadales bacterium]